MLTPTVRATSGETASEPAKKSPDAGSGTGERLIDDARTVAARGNCRDINDEMTGALLQSRLCAVSEESVRYVQRTATRSQLFPSGCEAPALSLGASSGHLHGCSYVRLFASRDLKKMVMTMITHAGAKPAATNEPLRSGIVPHTSATSLQHQFFVANWMLTPRRLL